MAEAGGPGDGACAHGDAVELTEALATLEAAGSEQNCNTYRRHGAHDPMYGVSFSVMRPLAKRAKRDQVLALGLWATGNYDARILACMVADPAVATEQELDAWLAEIDVYVLVDIFVASLASQVEGVRERADRWSAAPRDWTSQAGWDLTRSSHSTTRPSTTPTSTTSSAASSRGWAGRATGPGIA
jgi:DNA alkylation repair enzyme